MIKKCNQSQELRLTFVKRLSFALYVSLIVALAFPAIAAPQKHAHATVELISDVESIQPGQPFKLGLHFKIDKEWHLYWRNPGDSGLEPMVNWLLPEGFTVSEFNWPAPKRKTDKDHTNYIYEKDLLLTVNVTPPKILAIGQDVAIKAELDYLICRFSCLPGSGDLSLTLPVSSKKANKSDKMPLFIALEKRVPKTSKSISATGVYDDEHLQLRIVADSNQNDLEIMDFYPVTRLVIENNSPFKLIGISPSKKSATFLLNPHRPGLPDMLKGVLITNRGPVAISAPLTRGKLNLSDKEKLATVESVKLTL